jgi:hypothetical protein
LRAVGEMDESDLSAGGINFDAPATFLKWPSLNGQRRIESAAAYLLLDGTLDECIQHFLAKSLQNCFRHLRRRADQLIGLNAVQNSWANERFEAQSLVACGCTPSRAKQCLSPLLTARLVDNGDKSA